MQTIMDRHLGQLKGEHLAFEQAANLCKEYRKEIKMLRLIASFEACVICGFVVGLLMRWI